MQYGVYIVGVNILFNQPVTEFAVVPEYAKQRKFAMKKTLKMLLVVFMLAVVTAPVAAYDEYDGSGPLTKLGRGIANVAFGPLELLKQPYDVNRNMGSIPGITYGVLRGVCFTIARVCVGVADIVTFPMPLPGCTDDPDDYGWGYGPMMRPAWVMDLEHNPWGFFYDDSVIVD